MLSSVAFEGLLIAAEHRYTCAKGPLQQSQICHYVPEIDSDVVHLQQLRSTKSPILAIYMACHGCSSAEGHRHIVLGEKVFPSSCNNSVWHGKTMRCIPEQENAKWAGSFDRPSTFLPRRL